MIYCITLMTCYLMIVTVIGTYLMHIAPITATPTDALCYMRINRLLG